LSFAIVIAVKGLDKMPEKLRKVRIGIIARTKMMLEQIGEEIVSRSTEDYLSGPRPKKLGRISGDLARSVGYKVRGNRVVIGSNLRYARIHELGGDIKPKGSGLLTFRLPNGQWISTDKVTIPDRPFLRPALRDSRAGARRIIARLANEAIREAMA
jgi:phage gpG-like protein